MFYSKLDFIHSKYIYEIKLKIKHIFVYELLDMMVLLYFTEKKQKRKEMIF